MATRQRRGGRYTAPGTGSGRAAATGLEPRELSPRQVAALRESFAAAFEARGLPSGVQDPVAARRVRALLAETALGFARAGFSDDRAVELTAHGYEGHVDQSDPAAMRTQLRAYTRDILTGRHGR